MLLFCIGNVDVEQPLLLRFCFAPALRHDEVMRWRQLCWPAETAGRELELLLWIQRRGAPADWRYGKMP